MNYIFILAVVIIIIVVVIDNRDNWNPPLKAPPTPKILKNKKNAPYNIYGRPTILNPKWATPHVYEEIEEFHDFLKGVRGSILLRKGKVPISRCSGQLLNWSYRPFREGYWKDFVTSGLTEPKSLHWYGTESMIPNPRRNIVESPLTLVTGEEDIIRILGGTAKIRLFSSSQPTFPSFDTDEHGDLVTDKFHHKIKGEEFIATDGMILAIPRGWAYRIQVDNHCIGVIRIPVLNPLSWMSNFMNKTRNMFSTRRRRPKAIIPVYDTDGPDTTSQESESERESDLESDY